MNIELHGMCSQCEIFGIRDEYRITCNVWPIWVICCAEYWIAWNLWPNYFRTYMFRFLSSSSDKFPRRGLPPCAWWRSTFVESTPNVPDANGGFYNLIEGCYNLNVWVSDIHVVARMSTSWWRSTSVEGHQMFRMPMVVHLIAVLLHLGDNSGFHPEFTRGCQCLLINFFRLEEPPRDSTSIRGGR